MTVRSPWSVRRREAAAAAANGPEAAEFLHLLARFRRRLHWVAVWRDALVSGLVGVAALECLLIARPGVVLASPLIIGALGVATSTLLLVSAYLRRPTLADTAAALDLRTRRDQGLASALQFAAGNDPVACLIHRAALARAAALVPRHVFPLEAPRHFPILLATVAAVSVVFALSLAVTSARWPAARRGVVSSGGAGQMPAAARRQDAAAPDRAADSMAAAAAAAPASPAATAHAMAAPREVAGMASSQSGDTSGRTDHQPSADADVGAGQRPAEPAVDRSPGAGGTADLPGTSGETGRGALAVNRSGRTGGAAGAAGGVAPAEGEMRGAGGVRTGALSGPSTISRHAAPPSGRLDAARYRAARGRAEAAVQQDRIPPRLRTHVRQYFATIRPARQP